MFIGIVCYLRVLLKWVFCFLGVCPFEQLDSSQLDFILGACS